MTDVMTELREIGVLGAKGDYAGGLARLGVLWESIPEPRTEVPNIYMCIEYAVALCLRAGDLDEAWRWALMGPEYNKRRQDLGEAEFLIGKVAFERGDMASAAANFSVANKKSNGRVFRGEDSKYKEIIKGK
jgi:hypothetical protein